MQTEVTKTATVLCLSLAVMSFSPRVLALDPSETVKVTPLMKTSTAWDGKPIAYPQGKAEVTAMRVEIAPGAETGWHSHAVPSFAVILSGELEVRLKDGRVKRLQTGDALTEVVNVLHSGRNVGAVPVKLVVFYAGAEGKALTTKAR